MPGRQWVWKEKGSLLSATVLCATVASSCRNYRWNSTQSMQPWFGAGQCRWALQRIHLPRSWAYAKRDQSLRMALAFAFSYIQQKTRDSPKWVSCLCCKTVNAQAFEGTSYKILCVFKIIFHLDLVVEIAWDCFLLTQSKIFFKSSAQGKFSQVKTEDWVEWATSIEIWKSLSN